MEGKRELSDRAPPDTGFERTCFPEKIGDGRNDPVPEFP